MNYNTDRPIESTKQDLLGRARFSGLLGKAITNYSGEDSLVIGLYGKWGSGKTSVINMMINEIDNLYRSDDNKPLIMRFAPWKYSDHDNLISLFFQSLNSKLEVSGNENLKKKVGKALSDYADAFDALAVVPVIGSGLAAFLKTLAKVNGENLLQSVDLDATRASLENALHDAN